MTKHARKRARPKKAAGLRKEDTVRFRVTGEQKQALTSAAEKDGLDLSSWLRRLALRAAGVLPLAQGGTPQT